MDIFNTGMAFTFGKKFNNGQPLRRYLVAAIPQFLDDNFKSIIRVCHLKPLSPN